MGNHIEALANGMGGPSMYLLWLACQKRIPATVSITADTGVGERLSALHRRAHDGTRVLRRGDTAARRGAWDRRLLRAR